MSNWLHLILLSCKHGFHSWQLFVCRKVLTKLTTLCQVNSWCIDFKSCILYFLHDGIYKSILGCKELKWNQNSLERHPDNTIIINKPHADFTMFIHHNSYQFTDMTLSKNIAKPWKTNKGKLQILAL